MNASNHKRLEEFALASLILLLLCHCAPDQYGAKLIVQNADTPPLHSVVVRVTGNSYPIGELAALETRPIQTYPTAESPIAIECVGAGGEKKELTVDCDFEPG